MSGPESSPGERGGEGKVELGNWEGREGAAKKLHIYSWLPTANGSMFPGSCPIICLKSKMGKSTYCTGLL